ncbi:MAG TPA: hypothetical protein VF810_01630 [Patescibacteria group bacterium]
METLNTQPIQEQPVNPNEQLNLKPFSINKPSHRLRLILIIVVIFVISGMLTYIIVVPSRKTLVSPATLSLPTPLPKVTTSPTPAGQPLIVVRTPTPNPLTSTSWKTYSNTTYNYTIKYPPDWSVRDLGALEPLVPSNIAFNPITASDSSRLITITINNRSYQTVLALGSSSSAVTVGGIQGTRQYFQDSNGQTSTAIILPRTSNLLVLRSKTYYLPIFNLMIATLTTSK